MQDEKKYINYEEKERIESRKKWRRQKSLKGKIQGSDNKVLDLMRERGGKRRNRKK